MLSFLTMACLSCSTPVIPVAQQHQAGNDRFEAMQACNTEAVTKFNYKTTHSNDAQRDSFYHHCMTGRGHLP
jgi:hypothetical protein